MAFIMCISDAAPSIWLIEAAGNPKVESRAAVSSSPYLFGIHVFFAGIAAHYRELVRFVIAVPHGSQRSTPSAMDTLSLSSGWDELSVLLSDEEFFDASVDESVDESLHAAADKAIIAARKKSNDFFHGVTSTYQIFIW